MIFENIPVRQFRVRYFCSEKKAIDKKGRRKNLSQKEVKLS